jgi:hypothetical protein
MGNSMANEARVGRLDRDQSAHLDKQPRTDADLVRLGLICAPGLPEKVGQEFCTELPTLLSLHIDNSVSWDVSVVVDPLTGSERKAPEILDACRERMLKEGWDMAVCLTDLPVYRSGQIVVADVSATRKVAGLSLPALGATQLRSRAREAILQLVEELYARIPELGKDEPPLAAEKNAGRLGLTGQRPNRFIKRRRIELVPPFRRAESPDNDMKNVKVDARFAAPKGHGYLRLLPGMVLANRPWKLFPSFRSTLAGALGTGAYALINSNIWKLADVIGAERHVTLMLSAIVAMVVWIIIAHNLWERPNDREARRWVVLYNAVTALTITTAVLISYVVLFILILLAAMIFVPSGYFQSTIQHPVDLGDYMTLAWMATSLATVAGALGSSLEDERTVREAAYGYRQQQRSKRAKEESENDSAAA